MSKALVIVLTMFCSGCASPYWQDRRADAADVFTATVGIGYGATARIGPVHAGLGIHIDLYGLEAGEVGELTDSTSIKYDGPIAVDYCVVSQGDSEIHLGPTCAARGKTVAFGSSSTPFWNPPPPESPNPARWTQIEVAAGLFGDVRLGFNPGELLDLLLGFFGVDLYGDDIARGERKNPHAESAQIVSHAESAEFAESDFHAESAENAEENP